MAPERGCFKNMLLYFCSGEGPSPRVCLCNLEVWLVETGAHLYQVEPLGSAVEL